MVLQDRSGTDILDESLISVLSRELCYYYYFWTQKCYSILVSETGLHFIFCNNARLKSKRTSAHLDGKYEKGMAVPACSDVLTDTSNAVMCLLTPAM